MEKLVNACTMRKIIFPILLSLIIFSSCSKKIDGSSNEAMKASIEKMTDSMEGEKKKKFKDALQLIMFEDIDFSEIIKQGNAEEAIPDLKTKLDGKTADDIIAEGEKIKAAIEQKKKEQAKIEISELYQKQQQSEAAKKMFAKFEIKRSQFYKQKRGTYYTTEKPIIELTVLNGTDSAISRAYFTGRVASPGRSVPWIEEDFNYSISGGLEPGEETTWYLAPNMYSDWGEVDVPKDAILTVKLNKLDGPTGKVLYSAQSFGKYEKERLEELLSNYPEFMK